LERQEIKTYKT